MFYIVTHTDALSSGVPGAGWIASATRAPLAASPERVASSRSTTRGSLVGPVQLTSFPGPEGLTIDSEAALEEAVTSVVMSLATATPSSSSSSSSSAGLVSVPVPVPTSVQVLALAAIRFRDDPRGADEADLAIAAPLATAPGLMHIFGKASFAPVSSNLTRAVFASPAHWELWEAAIGLRAEVDALGGFGALLGDLVVGGEEQGLVEGALDAGDGNRKRQRGRDNEIDVEAEADVEGRGGPPRAPALLKPARAPSSRQRGSFTPMASPTHSSAMEAIELDSDDASDTDHPLGVDHTGFGDAVDHQPLNPTTGADEVRGTRRLAAIWGADFAADSVRAALLLWPTALSAGSGAVRTFARLCCPEPHTESTRDSVATRAANVEAPPSSPLLATNTLAALVLQLPPAVLVVLRVSFCLYAVTQWLASPAALAHAREAAAVSNARLAAKDPPEATTDLGVGGDGARADGLRGPTPEPARSSPPPASTARVFADPASVAVECEVIPASWRQLEAGSVLATLLWECVDGLERGREYDLAILVLRQLLASPYHDHRRGRVWARLAIDLAHRGDAAAARIATREGLADPAVRGGDRIFLERRRVREEEVRGEGKDEPPGSSAVRDGDGSARSGRAAHRGRRGGRGTRGRRGTRGSRRKGKEGEGEISEAADDAVDEEEGEEEDEPKAAAKDKDEGAEHGGRGGKRAGGRSATESSSQSLTEAQAVEAEADAEGERFGSSGAPTPAGDAILRWASGEAAADSTRPPSRMELTTLVRAWRGRRRLRDTLFVRRPLNREVGEKSRFLGVDVENDIDGEASDDDEEEEEKEEEEEEDRVEGGSEEGLAGGSGAAKGPADGDEDGGGGGVLRVGKPRVLDGERFDAWGVPWLDPPRASLWVRGGERVLRELIRTALAFPGEPEPGQGRLAVCLDADGDSPPTLSPSCASPPGIDSDPGWVNITDWVCHCLGLPTEDRRLRFRAPLGQWLSGPEPARGKSSLPSSSLPSFSSSPPSPSSSSPPSSSWPLSSTAPPPASTSTNAPGESVRMSSWGRGRGGVASAERLRVGVEELALQEYHARGGWRGLHCEGRIVHVLAALFLWDVWFDPACPDVFVTPFQDGPLDLDHGAEFYAARESALQRVLARLASTSAAELVAWVGVAFEEHQGQSCCGVSWGAFSVGLLQLAAVAVGGPGLASICDALCWNHKHFHGGLPDLFLWRVLVPAQALLSASSSSRDGAESRVPRDEQSRPAEGSLQRDVRGWLRLVRGARYEARFVEVKGPRDHLSDRQRAWLRVLSFGGVPTDLCRVEEPARRGSKRAERQASAEHPDTQPW